MIGRLGAVTVCCAALTACTPGEHKGRVIAGLDDNGSLVAILGVCEDDERVELSIAEDRHESSIPDTSRVHTSPSRHFAYAVHKSSTAPMRVEVRRDQAPDGWSSDTWQLPEHGKILIYAETWENPSGPKSQILDIAQVDLAALPQLPKDAEDQAVEDC